MDAPAWSLKARWVLPVLTPPVENGVIEIAGDTIVAVRQGCPATHDLGDSILIPGLVNAHTHLDLTGFPRPVTPPPTFADWIIQVIQHRLRETPEQRLMAIRKGVRQSMAHGVTLLGDISSNGASSQVIASESVAATVYHEILGLNLERANQTRSAAANWLSSQSLANVLPAISPHAPYSTRSDLYAWAQSLSVPVQTHLAESFEEIALITHGSGPLAKMLHDLKLLPTENMPQGVNDVLRLLASQSSTQPVGLVHANYLPLESASSLGPNVTLIHCPRTHDWFGREPFPLLEWIRAGIPIALGTDGEACNPDLDILAEASTLFQMHPDIPPAKILEMCTINGAAVLGWKGKAGALAPGHYADMVSMATDSASTLEKVLENLLVSKPKSMKTLWRGKWR